MLCSDDLRERVRDLQQLHHRVVDRRGRGSLAEYFRGDALRDLSDDAPVAPEQLVPRVRLDVDEARRDHEPARVHALLARRGREHACGCDAGDAVARDADVAVEPHVAGAVHDLAVGDHHVVCVRGARGRARRARGEPRQRNRADSVSDHRDNVHPRRFGWHTWAASSRDADRHVLWRARATRGKFEAC